MKPFCHLHLHNEFSVLDGTGTSKQFVYAAKGLDQTHLALTNHGNVDGAIEHQKQCKTAGIKSIIGCELYVVKDLNVKDKKETRHHMTVLVENQAGWTNLLKILTIANIKGFYYRPRIDLETLEKHLEGLIIMSACSNSFLNMKECRPFLRKAIEVIGADRIFLEVMPHKYDEQIAVNKKAIAMADRLGLSLIATNDCHYPTDESAYNQEVLLAIQSKKTMDDPTRWKFSVTGLFLRSYDQMHEAFVEQDCLSTAEIRTALRNTMKVARLCEGFEIKQITPDLPSIGTRGQTDLQFLNKLIKRGMAKLFGDLSGNDKQIYVDRIDEELDLITNMNFERYFLIVWDLIDWCHQNDVMVGPGRGSVGGSLIAYLLGITGVDPIEYDLVFSRFMTPDRIDLPDIDMDFEDHKRHLIREYLQQKYGEFNIAGLSTFMTMKGKGILRDVSRAFDIPLDDVDIAAKALDDTIDDNKQIEISFKEIPECRKFKRKYPEVIKVAEALEGQIRGVGQHAAAVCISSTDLREGLNCNLSIRSQKVVANWDKDVAEFMGLVKLDILGLSALSVLNETAAMIAKNHFPTTIDYKQITFDDPKVFKQINKGNTTGVFQIGAAGLSKFCQKLGIDSFEHLIAATAVFRPGPLHSGMADKYVKIKNGELKVKKIHPIYDKITEKTHGIIVYQEQVMSIINGLSGIDMTICDKIRKLMAKSKGAAALDKFKEQFIEGCVKKKTLSKKEAVKIWKTVSTFGKYGFNRSHSVEYSMITYWDMWLKTYYPNEFLACCLTFSPKEKFRSFIRVAKKAKLRIRLPKVGFSHATNWIVDKEGNLFAPFISISGIGETSAKALSNYDPKKERKGFFSKEIMGHKIPGVNGTTMKILREINAFGSVSEYTEEEEDMIYEIF